MILMEGFGFEFSEVTVGFA